MFNLKERELYTYCAFIYWENDSGSNDIADITVFKDENPSPELLEECLPYDDLYHTEIVKITTSSPIPHGSCCDAPASEGNIYRTPNGDYSIVMWHLKRQDNYPVPVVGLKII